MNKAILILLIAIAISCKTAQQPLTIPVQYKERIVERLVAVPAPSDSASLRAYLECDEHNKVILKELSEEKSKNIQSRYSLSNGVLDYHLTSHPPVAYIPVKDTFKSKEVPVPYPVETKVNYLTGWQWAQLWAGRVLLTFLLLFGIYKGLKWKSIF